MDDKQSSKLLLSTDIYGVSLSASVACTRSQAVVCKYWSELLCDMQHLTKFWRNFGYELTSLVAYNCVTNTKGRDELEKCVCDCQRIFRFDRKRHKIFAKHVNGCKDIWTTLCRKGHRSIQVNFPYFKRCGWCGIWSNTRFCRHSRNLTHLTVLAWFYIIAYNRRHSLKIVMFFNFVQRVLYSTMCCQRGIMMHVQNVLNHTPRYHKLVFVMRFWPFRFSMPRMKQHATN